MWSTGLLAQGEASGRAGGQAEVALWRGQRGEKQRPPPIAGINLPAIQISLPDRGSASLSQAFGGLQPS